jgi:hypothetical protein
LWEQGGTMVDLNSFVPPSSNLILTVAILISDRGEIAAQGVLPNGDTHAILLVPCDGEQGDRDGCEGEGPSARIVRQVPHSSSSLAGTRRLRAWGRMSRLRLSQASASGRN